MLIVSWQFQCVCMCMSASVYVIVAEQLGKCETCVSHWIQNIDEYKFKLHIFHSCSCAIAFSHSHTQWLFLQLICCLVRDSRRCCCCCCLVALYFFCLQSFSVFCDFFVLVSARIIEFLNRLAQWWSLKGSAFTHTHTHTYVQRGIAANGSIRPLTMLLTLPLSLAILFQNGWISIWAHLDYNRARSVCVRACAWLFFFFSCFMYFRCMFSHPFSVWSVFKQHWHRRYLTFDANIKISSRKLFILNFPFRRQYRLNLNTFR